MQTYWRLSEGLSVEIEKESATAGAIYMAAEGFFCLPYSDLGWSERSGS